MPTVHACTTGRYVQRLHLSKSRLKIWEKRQRGRIQGLPKFFVYPLLSHEGVKLRTSNLGVYAQGSSEQKPLNYLGEKGSWAYPGTAEIFWVPRIISGTGKDMNFKFGRCIQSFHSNKSPLIIWETLGVSRDFPNLREYPLLSQECVELWTSNLAGIFRGSMWTKGH